MPALTADAPAPAGEREQAPGPSGGKGDGVFGKMILYYLKDFHFF